MTATRFGSALIISAAVVAALWPSSELRAGGGKAAGRADGKAAGTAGGKARDGKARDGKARDGKARDGKATSRAAGKAAGAATGTLQGVVEFVGAPPERKLLVRDSDPVCARSPRLDERVVVTDGKLRDVHVRLPVGAVAARNSAPGATVESGAGSGAAAGALPDAVIDQVDCMYTPRVVGVLEGQNLAIGNSDPLYHNVRGARGERTLWNLGQPARVPPIVRENLGAAGEVVQLRCDVHPWMRGYVVISDHPHFAVTGADGAFTLRGVPVGAYTLEAWHPELGVQTTRVTVRRGKSTRAVFRFR